MTSLLVDTLFPTIKKVFSDKNNIKKMNDIVNRYVDQNIDKLTTTGLVKRTLFTEVEWNKIYSLTGITPNMILPIVNKCPAIKAGTTPGNPFWILLTLIIRYMKMNKHEKEMNACVLYLGLSMYPSLHSKYFKYEPNEQIMAYTIHNMSNKYKIKQTGNLLTALNDTVVGSDKHYSKELIRGNDKDIADYILSAKTRLNGFMKNICDVFMKEHSQKNYLNYENDNEDDEGFQTSDSNSYLITRLTNAVVLKLNVQGPNQAIVTAAAKMEDVSVNALRNTLHKICKDPNSREEMKELISAILYLYLFDGSNEKENINNNKFLLYCMGIYKKANTTDPNIVKIKAILDRWITVHSPEYKKSNAVGTVNFFRKAMYTFFVFSIQRTQL